MVTQTRVHLRTLVLLTFVVHLSLPVCVEVPSATEAAVNKTMKLTCISCLKREEIKATTLVDWFFTPEHENNLSNRTHIYKYANGNGEEVNRIFQGRLEWNGSKDLQDVSIVIHNVTYKDSGFYECHVERQFVFESYFPSFTHITNITLKVKEQASLDTTALYSEIMMYVLLVFLTFWLLVEMVYCYRKISKSDEQAQDTAY